MVVPLALECEEICTGQIILQPISLKSDRLLEFDMFLRTTPCAAIHPFVVLKRDFAIHLVGLKNVFRTLRQRGMARVFNAGQIAIRAVSVICVQNN